MKTSRTEGEKAEATQAVLKALKEHLRPVFIRKFRASRQSARETAIAGGMSADQVDLYLEGFDQGWLRGAMDSASVKPSDLRPSHPSETDPTEVH